MAQLKEFSRATALPAKDDDDKVEIPDPILWDLAGGNVSEAKGKDDKIDLPDIIIWDVAGGNVSSLQEGGLPDIYVRDDDDDSDEPTPPETFDWSFSSSAAEAGGGATIVDFSDDWDVVGEDTGSGLGNDPSQWAPEKLPEVNLPVEAGPIEIHGNAFGNLIVGTDAKEVIYGHAGDDILSGLGGNDFLIGGFGDDTLLGGEGADSLRGGPGNDTLSSGSGKDLFYFLDHMENPGIDTITDFEQFSNGLPFEGDRFVFNEDNLAIADGETPRQNVIALEGDGDAELWADTLHFGLIQIAVVENLTAAELQAELEFCWFV